jgi:transposase
VERIKGRVAGLDVHRDQVTVCVRGVDNGERTVAKARFKTTTAGLAELCGWLVDHDVQRVVMEATGVYWKPVVRHEALLTGGG